MTCTYVVLFVVAASAPLFAGGGSEESAATMTPVVFTVGWSPNTNYIGSYLAQRLGYFADEGLKVDIVQPGEASVASLVAIGKAHFGTAYQEDLTFARTAEDALPIVAIGTVIQHNTSGFASLAHAGIEGLEDFVGKTYGGWGGPVEIATLKLLMESVGGSLDDIMVVNTGISDFFAVTRRKVDVCWVFEGWTLAEAKVRGIDLNYISLAEIDPVFDYYTPLIIASQNLLDEDPELARRFMRALTRGYEYAVNNPLESAEIFVEMLPQVPLALALESLEFLKGEFIADAPRWGEMKATVWRRYADWLYDNGLLGRRLDVEASFSNEYLPR